LGKGKLAVRIAEWFRTSKAYELRYVVPVVPEPTWTDSLIAWCQSHEVPFAASGHYRDLPDVRRGEWKTDLAFSVFYDRIIQPWFIQKVSRIINLHNGPLPRYRGVSPINWALKNEEILHGSTIHEITPGIDDGPIIAQVLYSIYPESDEVLDVYNRSLEFSYALFAQTMPILDRIQARPQNESDATYYCRADDSRLDERRGFTKALSIS
jgi:methionyl-tRNA formyltransferase